MDPTAEFAQLQLDFVDQVQWRYELIRPLVLLADGTATPRAQDTHTPNMATTPLTLVGNSADSRGLAQCRATVCCTLPNARHQARRTVGAT